MSKIYSILGFPLLASATCGAFELPDYDMDTTLYEEALNRLDIHDLRLSYSEPGFILSEQEKEALLQKIKFAFKKMNFHLDEAEYQAEGILKIDVRNATLAAIAGAVTGIGRGGPYGVITSACLAALAQIVYGSSKCFLRAVDHISEADFYAAKVDHWIRVYERGYW